MSHNKHLLRIYSISHKEAQEDAYSLIEDWGSEDNYREVIGSICKDGSAVDGAGDPVEPEGDLPLVDSYIKSFTQTIKEGGVYHSREELATMFIQIGLSLIEGKKVYDIAKSLKNDEGVNLNAYKLKEFIKELRARTLITVDGDFDIWEQDYRSWELDEFGVTELTSSYIPDEKLQEGEVKDYLVIIHMHH